MKRCKAIQILGEVFISHGGTMAAGLSDIKARMNPTARKPTEEENTNAQSQRFDESNPIYHPHTTQTTEVKKETTTTTTTTQESAKGFSGLD